MVISPVSATPPQSAPPAGGVSRIGRQRLGEQVADALIEAILAAEYPPGHYLPSEQELIKRFGVSRTAIREALRVLSARGFVTVEHGRGARVTEQHPQAISGLLQFQLRQGQGNLHHVLEARRMLEMTAAPLAARRAAPADLAAMAEALEAMADNPSASQYIVADLTFHRAIVGATHNPILVLLNDAIADVLASMREHTYRLPGAVARSLEDHRWVFEAIVAGDADRVRLRMAEVLDEVEHAIEQIEPTTDDERPAH
jgi:GntR family transcriptional repressor for pyruvate dehydrogenase complex